ncbi:SRPBCC family protein [Qipengyuania nanhaisediminis]|uniref:SRPBCC family protein n=1 Tax=Qipengyuania nanhaisediminis TaxID=604088 RepID=UPI0038B2AA00
MRHTLTFIAAAFAAATSAPAAAEVVTAENGHFVTRAEAIVEADPKAVWLALISPARWWSDEHTWSADAANLSLVPQAGGCFCEKIPEVDEPGRFTLEGSVEHMRVIQAYPEVALRMQGALGPLQSEPVTGVLTIAISEADNGTRIVWEYNVAGAMRYPLPVIAQAVDGVMTLQLTRLGNALGMVEAPAAPAAPPAPAPDPAPDGGDAPEGTGQDGMGEGGDDAAIAIDPDAVLEDPESPSAVDEAFEDLNDG